MLLVAQPLSAQHLVPDSLFRRRAPAQPILRVWEQGLLVGLTAGAAAIDQRVRNSAQEHRTAFKDGVAGVGNGLGNPLYVFPTLLVGAVSGKVVGSGGLYRVSVRALESVTLAGGAVLVLKSTIGRRRPNISPDDPFHFAPFTFKDNAFPSGHTAIAFGLATSLSGETKDRWSDVLFYSAATLTVFSRVNDDQHWLSDTVVGAAIGIMSGRLVQRWHRPFLAGPGIVAMQIAF